MRDKKSWHAVWNRSWRWIFLVIHVSNWIVVITFDNSVCVFFDGTLLIYLTLQPLRIGCIKTWFIFGRICWACLIAIVSEPLFEQFFQNQKWFEKQIRSFAAISILIHWKLSIEFLLVNIGQVKNWEFEDFFWRNFKRFKHLVLKNLLFFWIEQVSTG